MITRKIRMTQHRRFILEELRRVWLHLSADELYEKVRRWLPIISQGIVYRNLNILSECGMIQWPELGGAQRLFNGNLTEHYHIRCIACGHVEDAPLAPIIAIEDAFRGLRDYKLIGHRLEFIVLCPQCKQKERGENEAETGEWDAPERMRAERGG